MSDGLLSPSISSFKLILVFAALPGRFIEIEIFLTEYPFSINIQRQRLSLTTDTGTDTIFQKDILRLLRCSSVCCFTTAEINPAAQITNGDIKTDSRYKSRF
jgi:hypothetical protein